MPSSIERVRYYEREYLRSYDFIAEQTYHLEMRRRLNLALHLWGIVEGLMLRSGAVVPGAPAQLYVSAGMAIDAFGREIVVPSKYVISDEDLRLNRITSAGTYPLWIAYQRQAATPPAPGYLLCNVANQYTRWRESFQILIGDAFKPNISDAPDGFGALSDDPEKNPWPIRLGSIMVAFDDSNNATITNATKPEERTYIALRTQRIEVPVDAGTAYQVLGQNSPINPPTSLSIDANLFARRNLIVGGDFEIQKSQVKPQPATFPNRAGNVKVAGDLFLKGNLYASAQGQWLGIQQLVQNMMPDVQVGTALLTPAPGTTDPSSGSQTLTLTSKRPVVSSASVMVALAAVTWVSPNEFWNWLFYIDRGSQVQLAVSAGTPVKQAGSDNAFNCQVTWTIGPKSTPPLPSPPNPPPMLNVQSITVSYVAVFFP